MPLVEEAQAEHGRVVAARDGQNGRLAPGSEHADSVVDRGTRCQRHCVLLRAQRDHAGLQGDLDVAVEVERPVLQREGVQLGLAAQEVLGERRAVVGRVVVRGEDPYRPDATCFAVRGGCREARGTATDDHEAGVHVPPPTVYRSRSRPRIRHGERVVSARGPRCGISTPEESCDVGPGHRGGRSGRMPRPPSVRWQPGRT